MHQATHGKGPSINPSKLLSNQVDLQGNLIPQNAAYPDPISFPKSALNNKILGS